MKKKLIPALLAGLLALALVPFARAQPADGDPRDVLVYKDGDRVQGKLIEKKGEVLVFQSDRFGELRVAADHAVVIKAEKSTAASPPPTASPVVKAAAVATKVENQAAAEKISGLERFSPAVLAAKLREVFGPWHGRLAFSTEVVSDTADRTNTSVESQLKRKWKADEVQLNARHDYSSTNGITTTDLIKADGSWRHDFTKNLFAQYRPSLEWNRAAFAGTVPKDYLLLQQEIGAGLSLVAKPARKLRLGLSENLFNVWNTSPPQSNTSRTAESAFLETELKVPWGLLVTSRTVYYYSLSTQNDGWENRVEVTKKFTETLSIAVRHELRRGSPDGTAQDYTRLKLLLGLDF
ncbi:MAG: hypothetical protein JWQ83_73 [Lacunisphaera sp.]|nr:hypothetical protein [Lacunisphaera sp.]MDB6164933.1 hypothetical protein [Lacunisphaera sp.]